jgi:hypothetical protein
MLRKYLALSGSQAEVYYGNLVQSPERKLQIEQSSDLG